MKVFEKMKKIGKRCKVIVATAAAAVVGVVSSVCASAATVEASTGYDLSKAMTDAGTSIQNQFGVLVTTLIPVMVGILISGLGVYGIYTLIKSAKKIFNKVSG